MEIIAFSGAQGSGKTVTCKIIKDILHDYVDIYLISFADFLRDWIKTNLGNEVYEASLDRQRKDKPLNESICIQTDTSFVDIQTIATPRELLVAAGTFLRKINPDIFCAAIEETINQIDPKDNSLVLIDDIRFRNELKWLKEIDYPSTLVVVDRIDVNAENEIKDFLEYEEAEYMYQTYSYNDPCTSVECRNGITTMLRTVTGIPIDYES